MTSILRGYGSRARTSRPPWFAADWPRESTSPWTGSWPEAGSSGRVPARARSAESAPPATGRRRCLNGDEESDLARSADPLSPGAADPRALILVSMDHIIADNRGRIPSGRTIAGIDLSHQLVPFTLGDNDGSVISSGTAASWWDRTRVARAHPRALDQRPPTRGVPGGTDGGRGFLLSRTQGESREESLAVTSLPYIQGIVFDALLDTCWPDPEGRGLQP